MRELTARFPQQFATITWKASFTILPSNIQLIQKKHMELLGPVDLIISNWECQGFSAARFGKGLSDTRSDLFTDMVRLITQAQSISPTLGYIIENTPSQLDQREKIQEHYTLVKHYFGKPFLPNAAQCDSYVHQLHNWWTNLAPFSILQLALSHQRPQLTCFSHIGWSEFLPTSDKARETSLVSHKHNRKTKRSLAHLCLFPNNTHILEKWTRPGVSSCFSHLG